MFVLFHLLKYERYRSFS